MYKIISNYKKVKKTSLSACYRLTDEPSPKTGLASSSSWFIDYLPLTVCII